MEQRPPTPNLNNTTNRPRPRTGTGADQGPERMAMEMIGKLAKTAAALGLALAITVTGTKTAQASMTDPSMGCGAGTGIVTFGFPQEGPGRISIFAYRLDGGPWKFTNWYYTWNGFSWLWNGAAWEGLPGGVATFPIVGGQHLVEGWEYRVDPATNAAQWYALPSCTTSDFFREDTYVWN